MATYKYDSFPGQYKHKLYKTWVGEKTRCYDQNYKYFYRYGGRGIIVSEEFKTFKVWLDYVEALPNYGEDGYTIDRIDNDKNYERGNLRWASKSVQTRNTVRLQKRNKSGYRGVRDRNDGQKKPFYAHIVINWKHIGLGSFATALEAAICRDQYIVDNNLEHTLNEVLTEK